MNANSETPTAIFPDAPSSEAASTSKRPAKSFRKHPAAAAGVLRVDTSVGAKNPEGSLWWNESAKAAYLSFAFHAFAYVLAAVLFYAFGEAFFDDTIQTIAVRARLADEDVIDDRAFESAPEISVVSQQSTDSQQQLASVLETVENGTLDTMNLQDQSTAGGTASETGEVGTLLFKLPESGLAVTKGSFTAWTIPENPAVGDWYKIVVEVRVPDRITQYRLSDLTGTVVGTDGYSRKIPYDSRQIKLSSYVDEDNKLQQIKSSSRVKPRDNKVQLVLRIPPASLNLTEDTIKIKSRRLRESQELKLVFGK